MSKEDISRNILRTVFRNRRGRAEPHCGTETCEKCLSAHLPSVHATVKAGDPVTFVLPGFPCKSPNPAKVIGALPDMAEEIALSFLAELCNRVQEIYPPGVNLVICSDGRVFSDLIGVHDEQVTAYQTELQRKLSAHRNMLSLFSLDDTPGMQGASHETLRAEFDQAYGESSHAVREKVRAGGDQLMLYRAITRFLFEDALTPEQTRTRSALQRDARKRAYGVIRRSRAWGRLVANHFPNAVRLSIHPQRCGSSKFGIRLTPGNNTWLTPWHAVAVDSPEGFVLRRRDEAERDGARPVRRNGRLSHYESFPPASGVAGPPGDQPVAPLTRTTDSSH